MIVFLNRPRCSLLGLNVQINDKFRNLPKDVGSSIEPFKIAAFDMLEPIIFYQVPRSKKLVSCTFLLSLSLPAVVSRLPS